MILGEGLQAVFLDVEADRLVRSRIRGESELSLRAGGDGLRLMVLDPDEGPHHQMTRFILDYPDDLGRAVRLELDRDHRLEILVEDHLPAAVREVLVRVRVDGDLPVRRQDAGRDVELPPSLN